jgi:hypothetical protein
VKQPDRLMRERRWNVSLFSSVFLASLIGAGVAHAQSRADCSEAAPPGFGVSVGRSSPSFYLSQGVVEGDERGSVSVRGGPQLAARADLPVAGAWRARIEGAAANWRVTRQTYDGFQLTANDTVGHVKERQVVGMIGRQGGRSPVCGYVLAGGGIYSFDYKGARLRRPGVALAVGLEVPTGDRGAIQADVRLDIIDSRARYPIASTTVLGASLSVGWSHKF